MLEKLRNRIYIFFWKSRRKVGDGRLLLTRKCEVYGGTVYDATWSLKYLDENGKVLDRRTIQERANRWNLRKVINKIEHTTLPLEIDRMQKKHAKS